MKACIRWCCPCCLRGEPDEKPRVKVAYATAKSPNNADENVNLLKPDELPENTEKDEEPTVKPSTEDSSKSGHSDKDDAEGDDMESVTDENGMRVRSVVTKTVTTTSTKTSSDDGEPKHLTRETLQMESDQGGGDTDENTEVMEYVDKNGRPVRLIVKKTITTIRKIKSNNDGSSSVTAETRDISSGDHGPEKILINFGGGMPRPSDENGKLQPEPKPRAVQEKEVFLQFGSKPPATQESHIKVDIKGQPFSKHNINMFESRGHTTITTGSSGGDNRANNTVYQRSVITKTIGGGDGGTKVVEHSTKTYGHGGEHPIVVVKKEKSQINTPEWMEEQASPETKRKIPETSDISVHLRYPSDYTPKKKDLDSSVNESGIHPEDAKRDKPVISILSLDDVVKEKEKKEVKNPEKTEEKSEPPQPADEEDEDEEEDDGELDEFEEEIVVMEVRRKPRFHKALDIPKPEPEKAGIPIEDLLELPTIEVGQESAPDENLIDEKIESEERPPTVYEAPDFEEFFKAH